MADPPGYGAIAGRYVSSTLEWRHRAEHAAVRLVESLVCSLPERSAGRLGELLGGLAYSPFGIRRATVIANLRAAFPDASDAWVHRVAREAYRHLGRESAAIMRFSREDAESIRGRTVVRGWDSIEQALEEGRGAILATGHFGNWEIAAAGVAARGVPIAAVVRRQGNRRVDERLNAVRRGLGVETILQRDARRQVPRLLRGGGVVGMVADQDARRAGVFVPFFGRPASTHRGPALFAIRLNAPIFACTARRIEGAERQYELVAERVEVPRTGDPEKDVLRLTAELASRLEAAIRAVPEQYFWFHRRWKTRPPSELSGAGTGIITPSSGAGGGVGS